MQEEARTPVAAVILMGKDETAARSLAGRLEKLFKSFTIQVLTPQGRELPINVPVNESGE